MFSKLKYVNSNNDQKIRDGFFQYQYERGFIFPIKCFYGATGNFPVGFLVWNLAKKKHLKDQAITLDVFNADVEKIGTKRFPSVERTAMLNKWCPRPKWDGKSIMPTFVSAFNLKTDNKDKRNHVAPGFLCSVSSNGDDFQHTNSVFILSAPYANAGAFSVTPENFERAMVLHAVKKIPKATWTNDRDAFYAPNVNGEELLSLRGDSEARSFGGDSKNPPDLLDSKPPRSESNPTGLPAEFVADCVVWSAFADSNYAVSLRNVQYQGRVWQIANQMYPFLLEEVRRWPCAHGDIAAQLAAANEDRFLAKWIDAHKLSPEARAVLDAARVLYREFYANITHTPWMDWKIETWDVGYYQVRNAMKSLGGSQFTATAASDATSCVPPAEALRAAHDALRAKLLPQVYSLGFLNPDVEYFK